MRNRTNLAKFIPMIIGIISFIIILYLKISLVVINNISDILSNIINFVSITTGFLMTSLSILASTSNSKVMKKLGKYGKIKDLNIFYIEPIILAILIVILCTIELQFENTKPIELIISALIIAIVIEFIIVFFRIGYLSMEILKQIMEENSGGVKENLNQKVDANTENAFMKK